MSQASHYDIQIYQGLAMPKENLLEEELGLAEMEELHERLKQRKD